MFTDIIWDFDGTLIDTYPGMVEAFQRILMEEGISADEEEILRHMKKSQVHTLKYYTEKYILKEDFAKRFQEYEKKIDDAKRVPFDGVIHICKKIIENGGRNYIVTHRGNTTMKILKFHDMLDLFTEIVTKHNGFRRKPDPEAFTYIVDKYNIEKSNALGIGDRELDIAAAHDAGIRTCLFKSNEVSCSIKPDYTIDSLYLLEDIILAK